MPSEFRVNLLPLPVSLILAALLFLALDVYLQYDKLPPQVACHFDAAGRAGGWCTKREFVRFEIAIVVLTTASLLMVPLAAYYAPIGTLNMPHPEYWRTPEREMQARQAVAQWGYWFTAATLWFVALAFHETFAANLRQPPRLHLLWWLLGGYLAAVIFSLARLIWSLRPPSP